MHWYFEPKRWEDGGRTYARFGIRRVRPYVAGGMFWQRLGVGPRAPGWKRNTVTRYVRESMLAEAAHAFSFLFLASIACIFVLDCEWLPTIVILTANFLFNLLPIGVLRYNRARILSRRNEADVSLKRADQTRRV